MVVMKKHHLGQTKKKQKKTTASLAVEVLGLDVGGELGLPLVTVGQELFLVVQELLVRLGGVLKVGPCLFFELK